MLKIRNQDNLDENQKALLAMLILFYIAYTLSAVLIHIFVGEQPSRPSATIESFTGSLFWVMSIISLLFAALNPKSIMKVLIWLAVSASFGLLAIDKIIELSEITNYVVGEDDYIKVLMLLTAVMGLYVLYRIELPSQKVVFFFVLGIGFHTLFILSDMGDGDFFLLPIPPTVLAWAEELFELLSLESYLTGFLLHYIVASRNTNNQHL